MAVAAVLGVVTVLVQPPWVFDLLARVYPDILWRVETAEPVVALTFDDGPAPDHTPLVLALLEKHQARATFFMIGDRARAHPELVKAVRAAGHEVGNHSDGLRSTARLSDADFVADLRRAEAALGMTGLGKLHRPPGGRIRKAQLALLAKDGYQCVLGSAYPYDPAHPPAWYIEWLVARSLSPGAIVILHDGIADPSRTITALEGILVAGRAKGLRFVPVGEMLEGRRISGVGVR